MGPKRARPQNELFYSHLSSGAKNYEENKNKSNNKTPQQYSEKMLWWKTRGNGDSQSTDLPHPVNPSDSVCMLTKGSKSQKLTSSVCIGSHMTIQ